MLKKVIAASLKLHTTLCRDVQHTHQPELRLDRFEQGVVSGDLADCTAKEMRLQNPCKQNNHAQMTQMLPDSFPNQLRILGRELAELAAEEGAKERGSHGQRVRCVTQSLVLIDIGAAIHLYIITERKRIGLLSKMTADAARAKLLNTSMPATETIIYQDRTSKLP